MANGYLKKEFGAVGEGEEQSCIIKVTCWYFPG